MSNLTKALDLWEKRGHSRNEFASLSKIDTGTLSRLWKGKRGFTHTQRIDIYEGFKAAGQTTEALQLIKADLEDQIPPAAKPQIRVLLEEPLSLQEEAGARKLSPPEAATRRLIAELESGDPDAVAVALALYQWRERE